MTTLTFNPGIVASYNSKVTTTARTLTAGLGDGYTVRAGDGLNNLVRTWDVEYDNITIAQADTIENFLLLTKGYISFYWTPPRGLIGKWVCSSINRTPIGPSIDSITATFTEVFDL
jgi:phage-related protein